MFRFIFAYPDLSIRKALWTIKRRITARSITMNHLGRFDVISPGQCSPGDARGTPRTRSTPPPGSPPRRCADPSQFPARLAGGPRLDHRHLDAELRPELAG